MALACLKMMDFEQKEEILQTVYQNYAAFLQTMQPGPEMQPGQKDTGDNKNSSDEPAATRNAREKTNELTEI